MPANLTIPALDGFSLEYGATPFTEAAPILPGQVVEPRGYVNFSNIDGGAPGVKLCYGTANLSKKFITIAYIEVEPESRNRGVGKDIVRKLEAFGAELGCREVRGQSVAESEVFWEKMGYSLRGRGEGKRKGIHRSLEERCPGLAARVSIQKAAKKGTRQYLDCV